MNEIEVDKNSWAIFDSWYPPQETEQLSWEVFDGLLPVYHKILEKKYDELNSLLEEWDKRLSDLDKDPTYFNWDNFRPLRLSREEDWSDWLSHLIATSKSGIFCKNVFDIEDFNTEDYISPFRVEREITYEFYRADIIIEWQNHFYSHVEVKIGDEQLTKTLETGEKLREKYQVPKNQWTNYLLLLSEQVPSWEQLTTSYPEFDSVNIITWNDICIAIRRALLYEESIKWRVWAYSFLGAIEQKIIQFPGYRVEDKPIEKIDEKIDILRKGLYYEQ